MRTRDLQPLDSRFLFHTIFIKRTGRSPGMWPVFRPLVSGHNTLIIEDREVIGAMILSLPASGREVTV